MIGGFNYRVQITHQYGSTVVPFKRVGELDIVAEYEPYREGGNNGLPEQFLQGVEVSPIEFEKGLIEDDLLYEVLKATALDGKSGKERVVKSHKIDILVEVLARGREKVVKTYELTDCSIANIRFSELNAVESELHYATFSVIPEGVEILK